MSIGGWINLLLSVGTVTTLFVWCLYRVLFCAPDRLHGELDIDTKDSDAE